MAVAYKQVHEAAVPPRSVDPGIPDAVEKVILRCIEKEPERRFQTVEELEKALGEGYERPTPINVPKGRTPRQHHTTFIVARRKARLLMMPIQVMYLSIYSAALYHIGQVGLILETDFGVDATTGVTAVILLAMCGIATRVYVLSSLTFDHPEFPKKFRLLFPILWLLDSIWAASPLLLVDKLGGIILLFVALLAYAPFAQKTLVQNMPTENR
jgi:hypothetical protein